MGWEIRIASNLAAGNSSELYNFADEQLIDGTITTDATTGFKVIKMQLRAGLGEAVPYAAHIECRFDGTLVAEGKRRRPTLSGYDMIDVEGAGYGVTETDAELMDTNALAIPGAPEKEPADPAHVILENAIALAPLLSLGPNCATPIFYDRLSAYDGKTLAEVAKQLSAAVGADFAVWEGRKASWTLQTPPATADYFHPMTDCTDWEPDDLGLYTRVSVRYTDALGGGIKTLGPIIDYSTEAKLGTVRHKRLDAGKVTQAYATALGTTFLQKNNVIPIRATLGPFQYLKDAMGGGVPFYMVRATQWVQIGGVTEGRPELEIVDTTINMRKAQVTAHLGLPLMDDIGRIVELGRVVGANKAGLNPNTYAAVS